MTDFKLPDAKPPWLVRALAGGNMKNKDGSFSSVKTATIEMNGVHYVIPTIREINGELTEIPIESAVMVHKQAMDGIPFNTAEEAEDFSINLSKYLGTLGKRKAAK